MPLAAIIFAICSSFVLHASEEKTDLLVPGYIPAPYPCNISISCSDIVGPICTVVIGGTAFQAFGKEFPADNVCSVVVYRPLGF